MNLRLAFWLAAGILGLPSLSGKLTEFFPSPGNLSAASAPGSSLPDEASAFQLQSFLYYQGGSSTYENYSYEVKPDRSGTPVIHYSLVCDREIYTLPADEAFLEELSALIETHRLSTWNGFHGSEAYVMDGSSFGLSISCTDGTEISATGSNAFPTGFSDASNAIDDLFLGYLEENGIVPAYLS